MSESSESDPCDGRSAAEQKQEPTNVFEGSSPAPRDQLVVRDGYLIEESRVGQEAAQDEASDADEYKQVADYPEPAEGRSFIGESSSPDREKSSRAGSPRRTASRRSDRWVTADPDDGDAGHF